MKSFTLLGTFKLHGMPSTRSHPVLHTLFFVQPEEPDTGCCGRDLYLVPAHSQLQVGWLWQLGVKGSRASQRPSGLDFMAWAGFGGGRWHAALGLPGLPAGER